MTTELLILSYSMLISTVIVINRKKITTNIKNFNAVITMKNKIMNKLKKSIEQYLEYMSDVPIEYSVGK